MTFLFILTSFLFLVWVMRNTLFWVHLWQLKEYRLDRVLIHLRETYQGKNLLFSSFSVIKLLTIVSFILVAFNSKLLTDYQVAVFLIYVFCTFLLFKEIRSRTLKRPALTVKAFICVLLSFLVIFLLFLLPMVERFLWFLILDKFLPFVVSFLVFFLAFPTEIYRDWKIARAVKKIKKHRRLLVIGVTGSYGKSSTKDYIAQILGHKFNVLYTRGSNNTSIGIANTILSGLKNNTQVFVVEMGAYKIGEIEEMCRIINPKIGVLTAVSDQHLSLFGSIENTMKAKYELIESLPKNGLALFSGSNQNALHLYHQAIKRKILYTKDPNDKNFQADICAKNIIVKRDSLVFDLATKDRFFSLEAPVIGRQNIDNVLPGICIALYFGMTEEEIKEAVLLLKPLPKTMNRYELKKGISIIDDTFNASPDAVLAAIDYMRIYKGKKILILQPMIELGRNADYEHQKLGRIASVFCDYLFLTNTNFYDSIQKGVKEGRGRCKVKVSKLNGFLAFFRRNAKKDDVIVFEGKESELFLNPIFLR